MGPRYGRLYASAVLRPLAEQLVAALGVRPGEIVCDLMCDSGTLGLALGAAVGSAGRVLLVDSDPDVLAAAAGEVAAAGCTVARAIADAAGGAVAGGSCHRAASLCAAGFWPGASLPDEAERITRPSGTIALLTWDPVHPPAHERALADALRDEAGFDSVFLAQCLHAPVIADHRRWDTAALHDVVRFDGIAQYWVAMVLERPVAVELARVPDETLRAVRARCERLLGQYIAADGTMRIPVTATLFQRRSRDAS